MVWGYESDIIRDFEGFDQSANLLDQDLDEFSPVSCLRVMNRNRFSLKKIKQNSVDA